MASMSLSRIRSQLDTMRERHKRGLEHAKRGFQAAGDALVTSSSAALCGYVQGRYGGYKLFGSIPFEVLVAAGFHGVAVFGPKGSARQFHNLGNGALASYATAMGRGFGRQQRSKAGEPDLMSGLSKGLDDVLGPMEGGGALSTDDLIKMAERM
jgi:hypothetical protein